MSQEFLDTHTMTDPARNSMHGLPSCLGEPCRQRIFEWAESLLLDADDAEDIAQEICVRCLLGQRRILGDGAFDTWLHRATVDAASGVVRAETARGEATGMELTREAPTTEERSAQAQSEEAEAWAECVHAVLAQLTPRQCRLLRARYVDSRSDAEIAERLGETEKVVRSSLHRARKMFRHAFATAFKEDP